MRKSKLVTEYDLYCDQCGKYLGPEDNAMAFSDIDGKDLCVNCALKNGIIDAMAWLSLHGFGLAHHAAYEDGKVIAFQKWGRGFTKYVFPVGNDD